MSGGGQGGGLVSSIPVVGSLFGGPGSGDAIAQEGLRDITEVRPVTATEGARMWRFAGRRVRVPGTIIWATKIKAHKSTESVGGGKSSGSVSVTRYTVSLAVAFGQAFAGSNGFGQVDSFRTLYANEKKVWTKKKPSKGDDRYSSIKFHRGGRTASPDSVIESAKGTGKVPAFRDTCYVVIEDLELEDWGNSVPQTWEAIIEPDPFAEGSEYLVSQALLDVWSRIPDRSSSEIDVTKVTGANGVVAADGQGVTVDGQMDGLLVEGPVSPRDLLATLAMVYDLTARDDGGVLVFMDRGKEDVIAVAKGDLAATSRRGDTDRPVKIVRRAHIRQPTEVVVQFYSKKNGYRRDSTRQRVNAPENTDGENVVSLDLPLVLPRSAARRVARRRLWEPRRLLYDAKVRLPPSYIHVQESDYVAVPFDGQMLYVRVVTKTVGADFQVEIEGPVVAVRDEGDPLLTSIPPTFFSDPETDDSDPEDDDANDVDDPEDPDPDDYSTPGVTAFLMNIPSITDEEATLAGLFYAQANNDPLEAFKGADVLMGKQSGGPYQKVLTKKTKHEARVGTTITGWLEADAGAGLRVERDTLRNSIEIQLLEGTLDTLTDAEVGSLLVLVKEEIFAFRDVTALSPVSETVTATVNGTSPVQVTRSTGSWSFQRGQWVRMAGWTNGENDVFRRITAVSGAVLTLDGDPLTAEGPTAGVKFTANESGAYRLSHVIRGVRDTDDHATDVVNVANPGDRIVVLEPAELEWFQHSKSDIGKTRYVKIVPKGLTSADVGEVSIVLEGETLRPFRPWWLHWLRGSQWGSPDVHDVRIRWLHRTRLPGDEPTAQQLHEQLEKIERYVLEIYSDAGLSTLLRSVKLDFSLHDDNRVCQYTYTEAQQVADGLTAGAAFWCRVQQRSIKTKANGRWSATLAVAASSSVMPETGGMAAEPAEEGTVKVVT